MSLLRPSPNLSALSRCGRSYDEARLALLIADNSARIHQLEGLYEYLTSLDRLHWAAGANARIGPQRPAISEAADRVRALISWVDGLPYLGAYSGVYPSNEATDISNVDIATAHQRFQEAQRFFYLVCASYGADNYRVDRCNGPRKTDQGRIDTPYAFVVRGAKPLRQALPIRSASIRGALPSHLVSGNPSERDMMGLLGALTLLRREWSQPDGPDKLGPMWELRRLEVCAYLTDVCPSREVSEIATRFSVSGIVGAFAHATCGLTIELA